MLLLKAAGLGLDSSVLGLCSAGAIRTLPDAPDEEGIVSVSKKIAILQAQQSICL